MCPKMKISLGLRNSIVFLDFVFSWQQLLVSWQQLSWQQLSWQQLLVSWQQL